MSLSKEIGIAIAIKLILLSILWGLFFSNREVVNVQIQDKNIIGMRYESNKSLASNNTK